MYSEVTALSARLAAQVNCARHVSRTRLLERGARHYSAPYATHVRPKTGNTPTSPCIYNMFY